MIPLTAYQRVPSDPPSTDSKQSSPKVDGKAEKASPSVRITIDRSRPMPPKPAQSIHTLVEKQKIEKIKLWVSQHLGKLDPLNADQLSPLMLAAKLKFNDVCKIFIANDANRALPGFHKRTVLHIVAETNNLELARLMVKPSTEIDPKVSPQDNDGNTPLILATLEGHQNMITILLQVGADPRITGHNKRNVIHHAAYRGHTLVIPLFKNYPQLYEAPEQSGDTPLMLACCSENPVTTCQALINLNINPKVNPHTKGFEGQIPLHRAAKSGDKNLLNLFLAQIPEDNLLKKQLLNCKDINERTPLFLAAEKGLLEACRLLVEKGADPNLTDKRKRHPLHRAIENGHTEVIKFLIPLSKEFINARDLYGNTALSIAKNKGNNDIIKMLKENGATDDAGVSPKTEDAPKKEHDVKGLEHHVSQEKKPEDVVGHIFLSQNGDTYKVFSTVADGACALHGILGNKDFKNVYRVVKPRESFIEELDKQLKTSPILKKKFCEIMSKYLEEYLKNPKLPYTPLIFKNLSPGQFELIEALMKSSSETISQLTEQELKCIQEMINQAKKDEKVKELIGVLKCQEALLDQPERYSKFQDGNLQPLIYKFFGQLGERFKTIQDDLKKANQSRSEIALKYVNDLYDLFLTAYKAACKLDGYYFSDLDIELIEIIYKKRVEIYSASHKDGLSHSEGDGDLIVLYHRGIHYSRCEKQTSAKPLANIDSKVKK